MPATVSVALFPLTSTVPLPVSFCEVGSAA